MSTPSMPGDPKADSILGFRAHIARGCGTLPHCGEHPGTSFLFVLVLVGAAAGARSGWIGIICGAGVMLTTFGSLYLYGAYERSKTEEQLAMLDAVCQGSKPPHVKATTP